MIGLFLDDERNPEEVTWISYPTNIEWYVFRRMNDFLFAVYHIETLFGGYIISFDHDLAEFDLAGNENTGYKALKSVVDYCMAKDSPLPVCYFHTQNPVGRENMQKYYDNAKRFMED
jgi:hypothetical protein